MDAKTLEGYLEQQMLIAMPGMLDPNFARSVTLLCQHSVEGAIGITINRESGFTMGEILAQLDLACEDQAVRDIPVLEGGPVATERGFVLHTPMEGFESSLLINPDIMITTSRDILAAIAAGDAVTAVTKLENLRRKVDGCGATADMNDWITDCAAQTAVRAVLDALLTNLGA